jgi:hypothetical protein
MSKSKIGYMKCETRKCLNGDGGEGRVVIWENERGTLNYRCDECGASPYVRKGSGQYLAWQRDLKAAGSAAPAPQPAKKESAPQPAKAATVLG